MPGIFHQAGCCCPNCTSPDVTGLCRYCSQCNTQNKTMGWRLCVVNAKDWLDITGDDGGTPDVRGRYIEESTYNGHPTYQSGDLGGGVYYYVWFYSDIWGNQVWCLGPTVGTLDMATRQCQTANSIAGDYSQMGLSTVTCAGLETNPWTAPTNRGWHLESVGGSAAAYAYEDETVKFTLDLTGDYCETWNLHVYRKEGGSWIEYEDLTGTAAIEPVGTLVRAQYQILEGTFASWGVWAWSARKVIGFSALLSGVTLTGDCLQPGGANWWKVDSVSWGLDRIYYTGGDGDTATSALYSEDGCLWGDRQQVASRCNLRNFGDTVPGCSGTVIATVNGHAIVYKVIKGDTWIEVEVWIEMYPNTASNVTMQLFHGTAAVDADCNVAGIVLDNDSTVGWATGGSITLVPIWGPAAQVPLTWSPAYGD